MLEGPGASTRDAQSIGVAVQLPVTIGVTIGVTIELPVSKPVGKAWELCFAWGEWRG